MAGKRRGRGEGSIEQLPSGKFRAILSAGKSGAGRRVKLTHTADTKKEALRWLRDRQAEADRGQLVEPSKVTLEEWLTRWLEDKRPTIEPASYHWYERRVRLHLVPVLGAVPLGKLTVEHVKELHKKLTKREASASEQHKAATTLRVALKDATRQGLLARNVALDVRKPKVAKKEMRCLDARQARAFLDACGIDRLSALYDLELDAGLRPGELFALHWPDVDFAEGAIQVRRSLEDINGKLRLKATKTEKSRRRIVLTGRTVVSLLRHKERMAAEHRDVLAGPVFVDTDGGFLRLPNLRTNSFLRILKRADLPTIRLYDLRHTVATLLLTAGVNIKVVSERMGHESVEITLKYYAHCLPGMQAKAAAALESLYNNCPTGVPRTNTTGAEDSTQDYVI